MCGYQVWSASIGEQWGWVLNVVSAQSASLARFFALIDDMSLVDVLPARICTRRARADVFSLEMMSEQEGDRHLGECDSDLDVLQTRS